MKPLPPTKGGATSPACLSCPFVRARRGACLVEDHIGRQRRRPAKSSACPRRFRAIDAAQAHVAGRRRPSAAARPPRP
jgi:hypothetical protein